jgi:hypothetical protein
MRDYTDQELATLLAVILGPRRRPSILRPRPGYLPHPLRRLPQVQGVIRGLCVGPSPFEPLQTN